MYRLFTLLFLTFIYNINAQTSLPKSFNYQGIARDASGIPITSPFDIQFIIKDASTNVHNEVQTGIQPNALGLFTTLIGKPPNTLTVSLSGNNNGPFTLDVLIKTGSSFTLVGSQPLVSVPFALLAGHVASSYTNNILTIGANSYTLNTSAVSTTTLSGDVVGGAANTTVTALRNIPVSAITPTTNQILSFVSGSWTPVSSATSTFSPWIKVLNNVILTSITDNVGIGTTIPSSNLDIQGNATTTTSILKVANPNTGNSSPAIQVSSSGGAAINATENTASGANAGEFFSTNGTGVYSTTNSNLKPSLIGSNLSINSNPLAHGIYGKTSNPSANATGVFGENLGGGPGVIGTTYFPVGGVMGINQYTSASSGFAYGVYGITGNINGSASGVYGENKGGGIGVYGINTNSTTTNPIGVYGIVSNNTSSTAVGVRGDGNGFGPGVQGVNFGNGPAIHGLKMNTSPAGNAGRFEITNSGNSADAIFASTLGQGAAVHAITNTVTTSALSLWIENGHIRATGAPSFNTSAGTPTVAGGYSMPTVSVNGNDVRGTISFTTGVTGFSTINYCDIKINFAKSYSTPPIVIASPLTDLQGLSYLVTNVQVGSFTLRLYRSANMTIPITTTTAANIFNYIVIE